jgi:hypothetical protein
MLNVFEVHLTFANSKGVKYTDIVNCSDKVELARTLMTFKPKRGYKLISFVGEERPILF